MDPSERVERVQGEMDERQWGRGIIEMHVERWANICGAGGEGKR